MMEVARTPLGPIAVAPRAVVRLVQTAAEEVDGAQVVRSARALRVSPRDGGAMSVSLAIAAPRRAVLPELGKLVQKRVAEALETALGVAPEAVDVTIEAIVK